MEILYEFEEPFVVDHADFAWACGDHAMPLKGAVRNMLRWYRERRVGK